MNHKGFGKIASPQKSLNQEFRQLFRKLNKRGNRKNAPKVLHEISRIKSGDGKGHPTTTSISNQLDKDRGDANDSRIQSLRNYQGFDELLTPDTLPVKESFEGSHWQEWDESAIDSEIAALNFKSLSGNEAFDLFFRACNNAPEPAINIHHPVRKTYTPIATINPNPNQSAHAMPKAGYAYAYLIEFKQNLFGS